MRKKERVALITGAAGLLGEQHAIALLEVNFKVILVDINLKKLNKMVNILKKKFPQNKILSYKVDITKEAQILKLKNKILKKKIFVDTLVNNADINPSMINNKDLFGNLENYSIRNLKREMEVGIVGAFLCIKIFGKEMSKKNFGIIVNMGSDLAIIAPDHSVYHPKESHKKVKFFKPVGYSVSKFGLLGLTKYISTYWAKKNVRCNMLVAGGVKNNQPDYLIKNLKKRIPLNRMANIDEYKKALQFLCLDGSKYMTGQTLVLDGGRSVW